MTRIFSTNRAIREFYSGFSDTNTLLPKAISIAEFESKVLIVNKRTFIDNDTRFLLLKEATNFEEFKKLQFNPEFLTFLKHSQYIFKFFEELSSEYVNIEDLKQFDTYALYDEHIDALYQLQQNYMALLDRHKYVDRININTLYSLNVDYLKNLKEVSLIVDGFLSQFELKLFANCAKHIPFVVCLELNEYNKKTKSAFIDLGFDLATNHIYELDLSNQKIRFSKKIKEDNLSANVKFFNTRLSQIGFIFSCIEEFIQDGINAQDIVVVLPDESLVQFLEKFDTYKNLNFSMGFSLNKYDFYKRIEALELYLSVKKDEQKQRLQRLKIPASLVEKVKTLWKTKIKKQKSIEILEEILSLNEKESEKDTFKEEIFRFSKFLSNLDDLNLEQIFKLFLKRLKDKSEDDIRGGKITVMGVLETRGSSYKGVIVPDFSDDFVPRRSQKDLFLNTQIRKLTGLPTKTDRENLQKYYYHKLFKNAKKIAISSVANETTMPSRFLDELGLKYDLSTVNAPYEDLIFTKSSYEEPKTDIEDDIVYSLIDRDLSATKLNTLLTCKRKFYFKYIKRLEEPSNILTKSNASVGLKLHNILERVYSKNQTLDDAKKVMDTLKEGLLQESSGEMEEFTLNIWLKQLREFVQNEQKRYLEGFRIFKTEVELKKEFEGFKIKGKLDRIDIKDGKLYVIDYKSGNIDNLIKQKIDNMTNFQLEFYYLLAGDVAEVDGVFYYDLKGGKLREEANLQEKIEKLKSVLKSLKEPIKSFEMCEKQSNCTYCPYIKLCLRDN
jgi:RecB family exonuclease